MEEQWRVRGAGGLGIRAAGGIALNVNLMSRLRWGFGECDCDRKLPQINEQRDIPKSGTHLLPTATKRYTRIQRMSGEHSIDVLCARWWPRAPGYYAWRGRCVRLWQRAKETLIIGIRAAHAWSRGTLLRLRIAHELRRVDARHRSVRLINKDDLQGP